MKLSYYQITQLESLSKGGRISVEMTEDGLECIIEDSEQNEEYLSSETFKILRDSGMIILRAQPSMYFSFYSISPKGIEYLNPTITK